MNNQTETIEKVFRLGRLIGGSKSFYRANHPENLIYFNANLVTRSQGKVWWGDLDITRDGPTLRKLAEELGEPIFVLREMDARFDHESDPAEELIGRAVWSSNNG